MKSPTQKNFFKLLLLHRQIGLVVIWLVLWLATTGILLNHSDDLSLDDIDLKFSWVNKLYGLEKQVQAPNMAYPFGEGWLLSVPGGYYLDGQVIADDYGLLVGGVKLKNLSLLVTNESVLVLDKNADILEVQGVFHGLEGEFLKVGFYQGLPFLRTSQGSYLASKDLLEWKLFTGTDKEVTWSTLVPAPETLLNKINGLWESPHSEVSMERFILDLHSGRLFGRLSWLFMDIFALLLIAGSVSGFIIWIKLRVKK